MIRPNLGPNSFDNSHGEKHLKRPAKSALSGSRQLRYDRPEASPASAGDGPQAAKDADMDVTGAGQVGGAGAVRPVHLGKAAGIESAAPSGVSIPRDEVLISDAARSLSGLSLDPQVRAARLAEIKSAIEAGTYDTPQRLEAAIDKMISAWTRGA